MRPVRKEIDEGADLDAAVAALEGALLDYVEHYGLTPRARDALAELDRARSRAHPEQAR